MSEKGKKETKQKGEREAHLTYLRPATVAKAQPTRARRSSSTSASRQRRVDARAIAVATSLLASSPSPTLLEMPGDTHEPPLSLPSLWLFSLLPLAFSQPPESHPSPPCFARVAAVVPKRHRPSQSSTVSRYPLSSTHARQGAAERRPHRPHRRLCFIPAVVDLPATALPRPLLRLHSNRGELANETPLSPRPRTSSSRRFRKLPSSPPLAMAPPRLELLQPASGPANELRTLPGDEHHHQLFLPYTTTPFPSAPYSGHCRCARRRRLRAPQARPRPPIDADGSPRPAYGLGHRFGRRRKNPERHRRV